MIEQLTNIARIILFILIVIIALGLLIMVYFKKYKRKNKAVEYDDIDYSSYDRKDSVDLCKFEDIVDDMIITDNGTRFVGIIKVRGFDYFYARPAEKNRTEAGYASFVNMIKEPMVYRQYTKAVDLSGTRAMCQSAYEKVEADLFLLSEEFNQQREQYFDLADKGKLSVDMEEQILDSLEEKARTMEVLEFRRDHLYDNLSYIDAVSNITSPEKIQTYTFDWVYDPLIGASDLTAEQIREKAVTELNRKAAGFIHALSNAGVRATRVRTAELKFMMRRHWHPLTADEFNPYLYEGTNAYDDVTSSSGMKESDYEMAEENGTMSEIISLQQKKYDEMIDRGVEPQVAEEMLATFTKEDLEKEAARVSRSISTEEIKDRKEAILTNKFEEHEKVRQKEKERNKKLQKIKELEALDNKNLKNPTNPNPDETAFINSFLPKLGGKN